MHVHKNIANLIPKFFSAFEMLKHVAIVSFSFLSLVVGQCRFNQFSFGGSCYEISMTSSSWSDGEGQCQSLGGHLISIGSQFENTAVSGSHFASIFLDLKA
jgi:hypothetical protein